MANAVGYGNYWLSRAVHCKASIEHFLPPVSKKPEAEVQTTEEQELLLRSSLAKFRSTKKKQTGDSD